VALLTGCASVPVTPEPHRTLPGQTLMLDGPSGEHQLVSARSSRARALAAAHPGRPKRLASSTSGVVSLGNVSIPLGLGAPRLPASVIPNTSVPEESSP
jgi:hypothetical protein